MGKKKLLKNIAYGILSSFVSRNNDINGYWGIGKLYSSMVNSKSLKVEIDLIKRTISLANNELNVLVSNYSDYLINQLRIQNINRDYVSEAKIEIVPYPNNPRLPLGRIAPNKMNCKITIIDNLNKNYTVEKDVWCRAHNPKLESKRA